RIRRRHRRQAPPAGVGERHATTLAGMTTPVTLHSKGSFRNEVEAGPHRFVIDEPADAGGNGEGPTPYDLLSAALAGCTSMTLHYYAKREKLPLAGVDVTVVHDRQYAKDCADCVTQSGYIHR